MSKSDIQVGDRVMLIDKPWEHDVWGALPRDHRAEYMKCAGQEWTVERTHMMYNPVRELCASGDHKGMFIVPLCLLRKVEQTTLTWVEPDRERMKNKPHPKIKKGTKFIIVDEKYRTDIKAGEIVTLWLNDDSAAPIFQKQDGKNAVLSWHRLAPLTPAKHRYTPEQEAEAREIVYRLMMKQTTASESAIGFKTIVFKTVNKETMVYLLTPYCVEFRRDNDWVMSGPSYEKATAKCSPHDEFSTDIGRMVALCKLLGEPLPEWIRGDSK